MKVRHSACLAALSSIAVQPRRYLFRCAQQIVCEQYMENGLRVSLLIGVMSCVVIYIGTASRSILWQSPWVDLLVRHGCVGIAPARGAAWTIAVVDLGYRDAGFSPNSVNVHCAGGEYFSYRLFPTWCFLAPLVAALAGLRIRRSLVGRVGRCRNCGYDLRGSPTRRCSECGQLDEKNSE